MYFDFYDNHPDIAPVGAAEPGTDRIVLSIPVGVPRAVAALVTAGLFHLLALYVILLLPYLDAGRQARIAEQMALLQQQRDREQARFVFVEPHLDLPAAHALSPRAEASDKDRNAQTRERAKNPTNDMPFSRGNTSERVEALRTAPPPPAAQAPPQPADPAPQANGQSSADAGSPPVPSIGSLTLQGMRAGNGRVPGAPAADGAGAGQGLMGSAMRDLRQMVQANAFDNQGGTGEFGPSIQFDTKGVEFGPWLRRFIAQIRRNWLIPYAAMAMKGHVVVTFYIHKDGTITELAVPGPCNVDAFNRAAYNAMASSNPTYPLPPEYPSERAFFTVIFYYNETPPGGGS